MHPFQASYPCFPNQNQSEGESKSSSLQQVKMSNPNNHAPSNSQPHQNNPQYPVYSNNPNTYMSNGNGSIHNPHLPNLATHHQLPMPNMQIAFPQSQFFPQTIVPQMHGLHHSIPQNGMMSQPFFANNRPQVTNMPFGQLNYHFSHHPNQINGFAYGQFPQQLTGFPQVQPFNMPPCLPQSVGSFNQGALPPGSQNAFFMNPQSIPNQIVQNAQGQNICTSTMGQNALQESLMNGQPVSSLNKGHAQMQQPENNKQFGVLGKSQVNRANDSGGNISNISERNTQEKDFTRNKQNYSKRESRNMRFQKSNNHPMSDSKGNFRSFERKGPNDKVSRNPLLAKSNQEAGVERQSSRSLPLNYTQEEIQKWREERKKNHPFRSNTEKKTEDQTHSESVDLEAQKRRQELEEILAKQAELGVEVAEIPESYLLDSKKQANETELNATSAEKSCKTKQTNETEKNATSAEKSCKTKQTNETEKNATSAEKSCNKRGGKRQKHGRNRSNKKQKLENNYSSHGPAMQKKNLTLLQKLLSADIKREKSQLLQAFRFMVLNNFFTDCPKRPLEFPSIKVKAMDCVSEPGKEASLHQGNGLVSSVNEKVMVDKSEALDEHDILHEDDAGTKDRENKMTSHYLKETDGFGEAGEISE